MSVTRERFEQGLTYADWKARMTRNREHFEENERAVALRDEDLVAFRQLRAPLHVLVLAEDWCGDVIANFPILGRIALETGKLDVRVFPRDENEDLMNLYLNRGAFKSIPVFAFFDESFSEIGRFIERPESVTELRAKQRAEIDARLGLAPGFAVAELPEQQRLHLQEELTKMREETKPFAEAEVVRELREIVARTPVR